MADLPRLQEIIEAAEDKGCRISDIVLERQLIGGGDRAATLARMHEHWDVMKRSAERGIVEAPKSKLGIIGGEGKKLWEAQAEGRTLAGPVLSKVVARAIAVSEVNAAMGQIVAAPTAGSAGVIPGVLVTLQEELAKSDEEMVMALLTSAYVGFVVTKVASVSGAAGGCQAENGSAASMAAAAGVELCGGTPTQAGHAAAIAMKGMLGVVCDPVAGLVEIPCVKRNAAAAALALSAIDMAMAGIPSHIPADEVFWTMGQIGRAMPEEYRETALGGLAVTPTGKVIAERLRVETD